MLTLVVALFSIAVTALADADSSLAARQVLSMLDKRQTTICKAVPAPATCETSCGPEYVTCVSFPHCYAPSKGEVCCSNGSMFLFVRNVPGEYG